MPDRPDPSFGAIRTISKVTARPGYNALVLTAQKRMSNHFQFNASYTYSKTMDNGEDFYGVSEPANPLAPLSQENALAQIDIRHLANFELRGPIQII